MEAFKALQLDDALLQAITDLGFELPTEIQEKTIPLLLNDETDLVALAQTGTGKTAAFGFPMLQKIQSESRSTQGLIIAPTRELCLQITNEMVNYGKYIKGLNITAIYGGASISEQAKQIKKGSQIIVATPGRLKDMIGRNMIDITKIEYAVLDEADEMLNMGFYEDITHILSYTPKDKSTWLFSATMPKEVAKIAKKFMHSPAEVTVGTRNEGAENVSHEYYVVSASDRYSALKRLADSNPDIFSVVFCRTKRDTQKIAEKLIGDGYNAGALHGDLSQNQRDLVMKAFRKNQIQMLVATDVAARGIDVDDITHVINYQLPDEIETYTHRSGRTGRAGKSGVSMVIVSKSEVRKIKSIERIIGREFERKEIPDGMEICQIQLMSLANKVKQTKVNHDIDPYLDEINELLVDISKEELIKKLFSVEFSRFHDYYKNAKDLNQAAQSSRDESSRDKSSRFFINVGSKDGFDWKSLKDFLKEILELGRDGVFKVDVKGSFSFFNTESSEKALVLERLNNFNINGRPLRVEVTEHARRDRKKGKRGAKHSKRRDQKMKRDRKGSFAQSRPRRSRRR